MQKKINKWVWIIIAIVSVVVIACGTWLGLVLKDRNRGSKSEYDALFDSANKVVLFIGDGMGDNHIKTASAYLGKDIFFTGFEIKGHCTTNSNAILSPTDSAAAASALATGQKFDNSEVSRHNGKDITTISELAMSKGYDVGIVTTDSLSGATPASFSSHANKRGDKEEIITGQIKSNIKLFLGAGKGDYDSFQTQIELKGYTYISDYSLLSNTHSKVFGTFERVGSRDGTNTIPTLEMLTTFAIDYMENNCPQGYFLMIEGAHIDKRSHANNIESMIRYLDNFDASIKCVYDKIASQIGTAIIVTADHETGGLKYNGETKSQISDSMYTRTGHSSADVPYYVHLNIAKTIDVAKIFLPVIDNTNIFRMCKSCLGVATSKSDN